MKNHARLAFAVVVSIGTALSAQGFNVRTGTWEFTMTVQGTMPMDGVPPEARAQIEAELKKPQTYKSCVTADDVKNLNLGKKDDGEDDDCKVVTSKIGASSADITRQCTGDEPRTETMHYEAPTPQTMRANISSKGKTGTMTMAVTGKWVSAQCKE